MKLVTAVIRPERVPQVKAELLRSGVKGVTLSRVSGHGGEEPLRERYRGSEHVVEFHEKVELRIAVEDRHVEATIAAIVRAARTGAIGDGKIFVLPLEGVVRIRTGERDAEALTPVGEAAGV